MNFKCSVIAHSVNPVGDQAVSFELCHERFIHAEFMTHRSFSRNASSSRAIPFSRMLEWTAADPAMPLHLGRNKPGMQSGFLIDDPVGCVNEILGLFEKTAGGVVSLVERYGLHKEVANRYLEPWGYINALMTTGRPGLMNFFKLRMTPLANPNTQRLAVRMARAYRASTPEKLKAGQWHLTYVTSEEKRSFDEKECLAWSAARSAWISYKTADGKVATFEKAKKRHDDLVDLKHSSPLEHQLRARSDHDTNGGNVRGYDQYRHMTEGESCSDFDYEKLLDTVYRDQDFVVA